MKKQVYLHVGLPKCASTSIQYALYSCGNMDFGGLLPVREAGTFWRDSALAELFDCELRFNASDIERHKDIILDYVSKSCGRKIVFSSENISLRFLSWDLPTWHKLRFIKDIMPDHTHYLFVYRSPYRVLVSLYKEMVLLGFHESFHVFCDEIFRLRQFSFFNDVLLGNFLDSFDRIFPKSALTVIYADSDSFEEDLSRFFDENVSLPDEPANVSITNEECEVIVEFNRKNNDYNIMFDMLELHRIDRNWNDERKYSNARKRRIRKAVSSELIKYAKSGEDVVYRLPRYVAGAVIKSLRGLLERRDSRVRKRMIEKYIEEMELMSI